MVDHWNLERARVLERRAHQVRARHRLAIVAHRDCAGSDHFSELREDHSLLPYRNGADRVDPRRGSSLSLTDDESNSRLIVRHRVRVRHRAHRGESAGRRRTRAGCYGLDILATGLAEVAVHVIESRREDESVTVDRLRVIVVVDRPTDTGDFAVDDEEITDL